MDVIKIPESLKKDFRNGTKNSVSVLFELGAQISCSVQFKEMASNSAGLFCTQAIVGNIRYATANGVNKKSAKINAASAALKVLLQEDDKLGGLKPGSQSPQDHSTNEYQQNENNPLRPLQEFCSSHKIAVNLTANVPTNSFTHFSSSAVLCKDNKKFVSECSSKKLAKSELCHQVMDHIMAYNKPVPALVVGNHFDQITKIALSEFSKLLNHHSDFELLKSGIAAFIIKRGNSDGQLISLASGSCCPSYVETMYDDKGRVLLDCHSYSLARRSFVKFLYAQIKNILVDKEKNSIFRLVEPHERDRFHSQILTLKENISVHLYLGEPPCGDARFDSSQRHISSFITKTEAAGIHKHQANFSEPEEGTLSYKNLATVNNSVYRDNLFLENKHTSPTLTDAHQFDKVYKSMSCSDKILKANMLGVQGSMLASHVGPIYLSTITVGSEYSEQDFTRAFCCRVDENILDDLKDKRYHVNHPYIGRPTFTNNNMVTCHKNIAFNHTAYDGVTEILNSSTGLLLNPKTDQRTHSRLCKSTNLVRYRCLHKIVKNPATEIVETAEIAKCESVDYEAVKLLLYDYLYNSGLGSWVKKPIEYELFMT